MGLGEVSPLLPPEQAVMTLGLPGKKGLYALPQYEPLSIPAATSARRQQLQERAIHPSSNPNPCKRLHYASYSCCKEIETLPHRNQEENRLGVGGRFFAKRRSHQRKQLSLLIVLLGPRIIKETESLSHTLKIPGKSLIIITSAHWHLDTAFYKLP